MSSWSRRGVRAEAGRTGLFAMLFLGCASLASLGCRGHSVTLQDDNDLFGPIGQTDRWYTHGIRLEWMLSEEDTRQAFESMLEALPLFPEIGKPAATFVAGQQMFTAENLQTRQLVRDDRPYAGWLYGGILFQNLTPGDPARRDDRLDTWGLDLGIVGPSSGASRTHREAHRFLDRPRPQGWRNQLRDEPGLTLRYGRLDRLLYRSYGSLAGLELDLISDVGFSLGNIDTSGSLGGTVRLGGLQRDFTTKGVSLPLRADDAVEPAWPGYLFAGVDLRLVARNIFLDGNTYKDSHSVDKKPYTVDFTTGIAFPSDRFTLSFAFNVRTPEFDETSSFQRYGSIRITYRF